MQWVNNPDNNYKVRYDGVNKEWVLIGGNGTVLRRSDSKKPVVQKARSVASNQRPSILRIEGVSGGVQDKITYD